MPKLSLKEQEEAAKIFNSLIKDGQSPIQEDDGGNSANNLNKVKTESGYSFPPIMELQGLFLEHCGTGNFKRVLDIGPGHGNDTIPLLLTNNVQVVAVDIHSLQLAALKQRVTSKLTSTKHFGSFKKDFADKVTKVPEQYKNGFQAVNLSRVAHFLTGTQLATLVSNVAAMMSENAVLSLTVSTFVSGSREEQWIASQEKQGLEDPGLVYYDQSRRLSKSDPSMNALLMRLPGTFQLVKRSACSLPSPGHKVEFLTQVNSSEVIHTLRTGKYYHTPSSLHKYLSPYFDITDATTVAFDEEDIFLAVFAKKKALQK